MQLVHAAGFQLVHEVPVAQSSFCDLQDANIPVTDVAALQEASQTLAAALRGGGRRRLLQGDDPPLPRLVCSP